MKSIVLAFVLLFPFVALAIDAVEVNARDHTCDELAQIIRKDKAVFVRMGFGGRSFRYPPASAISATSTTRQGSGMPTARFAFSTTSACTTPNPSTTGSPNNIPLRELSETEEKRPGENRTDPSSICLDNGCQYLRGQPSETNSISLK